MNSRIAASSLAVALASITVPEVAAQTWADPTDPGVRATIVNRTRSTVGGVEVDRNEFDRCRQVPVDSDRMSCFEDLRADSVAVFYQAWLSRCYVNKDQAAQRYCLDRLARGMVAERRTRIAAKERVRDFRAGEAYEKDLLLNLAYLDRMQKATGSGFVSGYKPPAPTGSTSMASMGVPDDAVSDTTIGKFTFTKEDKIYALDLAEKRSR